MGAALSAGLAGRLPSTEFERALVLTEAERGFPNIQDAEESSQEHKETTETDQSDHQVSPAKKPTSSKKNIEEESYTLNLKETQKSY